ncbi:hypothetical protein [Streptomyces tanashiensis]|uniref:Gliding motility protein n=1 Tax=Streptomyces tanashiensis TaxID=67367 RepID=A0ABY6QU87_9ACTN|nr:hypothetical protein [Streptomyces tanashiensis]UZX21275.1 hypothetical protein LDH80_11350 [Streptomyces tanashiensis]GGY50293.1 hypothetical protein GCM10010299_65760 [Streptomyces tanashiensis]
MGVFAMFRRKKQDTAEATVEEAGAGTDTGEDVTAEALTAPAEDGTGGADGAEDVETDEVPAGAAAEVVEIPKQQSAEAAADNGTGEGARR